MPVLLIAVVSLYALCGCSPQKKLAHRLKDADRVIFARNVPGYEDLKTTVRGEDVNKVVQAITNGQKVSRLVEATPSFRLEFFKGSEPLAIITNTPPIFWIGQIPYMDTTETLQKLHEKYREEHPPIFSP